MAEDAAQSRVAERTVIGALLCQRHAWPSASSIRIVVGLKEGRLIGCWIRRGRRGGAIAHGSAVRTMDGTREDIRGRR